MHVVINDRDTGSSERSRVRGSHRYIVEETEPHGSTALGVVTWRTHEGNRPLIGRRERPLDSINRGPSREAGHIVRFGRRVRIRIEREGTPGETRDPLNVLLIVHAGELLVRGDTRGDDFAALRTPFPCRYAHDVTAFRRLGVTRRRLMVSKAVGVDDGQGHRRILRHL
jgi:hypothetical protein